MLLLCEVQNRCWAAFSSKYPAPAAVLYFIPKQGFPSSSWTPSPQYHQYFFSTVVNSSHIPATPFQHTHLHSLLSSKTCPVHLVALLELTFAVFLSPVAPSSPTKCFWVTEMMDLDHSLESQVILSLKEQLDGTLSCPLRRNLSIMTRLKKIICWKCPICKTSGLSYTHSTSWCSSLNAFLSQICDHSFLPLFSLFIKIFYHLLCYLPPVSKWCSRFKLPEFSGRQLWLPRRTAWNNAWGRGTSRCFEAGPGHRPSRKWFPLSLSCSPCAAGQIQTSELLNSHRHLICSPEEKNSSFLFSYKREPVLAGN